MLISSLCLLVVCGMGLPGITAARAAAAAAPQAVNIALATDAYWYRPGSTMNLIVTLDNTSRQTMRAVSLRVRIHAPNTTRADLDASYYGKPGKSYRRTETFGPLTLEPGNNQSTFSIPLKSSTSDDGVYPMTVQVIRSGSVVSSAVSEIIVMSPEQESPEPVKLSLVFDTLELPHRDPTGDFSSDALARECDPSGQDPGWYPTLLTEMEKWQAMNFNISLSPMLLEEIAAMSNGYVVKRNGREVKLGTDSREARDAAAVLTGFKSLTHSPRYQLLPEPYASPNLETLVSLKWRADANKQISSGHKVLEETLDTSLSGEFSCPPALLANTRVINELGSNIGQFLVLSPQLLERSTQGRRLLRGKTLTSTVLLKGGNSERKELALFADERIQDLIGRVSASGDPHGVAQVILAELTNLYLENPGALRGVVAVAPGSWHPSKDVLDELMRALSGAPWLKTVTLAENMMTLPTVNATALDIPGPQTGSKPDTYFRKAGVARDMCADYHEIVLAGNPFLVPLQRDVYTCESDVWREWNRKADGLRYAGFVTSTVDGELDKVSMPAVGSMALTSTKAKIPLSVINGTGYRIKAELKCASNGLTVPVQGTEKVLLEPKENLFEVPVKVKAKGRVRFSARLVAGDFTLGELDFSVRTSRFNTFAILLVAGLLALIGIVWSARFMSRRKAGKHRKQHPGTPVKKEPSGAGGAEA